jgi:multiple sugar transport system ATP-binding protein
MTMGDRICVMNLGQIMQVDTPLNLYSYPINKFVAGFIGSPAMNFAEGEVINKNGTILVKTEEVELELPQNKADKVKSYIGKKVWLGIRPEHINLKEGEGTAGVEGVIDVIEHMGNESFVYFNFAKNTFTAKVDAADSRRLKHAGKEKFMFHMEECHIFDFESEVNISL